MAYMAFGFITGNHIGNHIADLTDCERPPLLRPRHKCYIINSIIRLCNKRW
jgi:hypothetical protein